MTEIRDRETGLTLAESIKKRREQIRQRQLDEENRELPPTVDQDWVAQSVAFPFHIKVCFIKDVHSNLSIYLT